MAQRTISVGVDFGADGKPAFAFYEPEERTVAFYDSLEAMQMLSRLMLVNEGVRVITTFPSEDEARTRYEVYYRLLSRIFPSGPYKTAWVRKGRRKTKRF